MNKKFSTLVASILLAGALGFPVGAYAQVGAVTGFTPTELNASFVASESATTSFLVAKIEGVDNVLTFDGDELKFIPITEVTSANLCTITRTNGDGKEFTLEWNGKKLGVKKSSESGVFTITSSAENVSNVFTMVKNNADAKYALTLKENPNSYSGEDLKTAYLKTDATFTSATTEAYDPTGFVELASCTVDAIANITDLPSGYSVPAVLADQTAGAWRYFVQATNEAWKLDNSSDIVPTTALNAASKITVTGEAGKYVLTVDGKTAYVDNSTKTVKLASNQSSKFDLLDFANDGGGNDNKYLSFVGDDGKTYVVTYASTEIGASVYKDGGNTQDPVANALAFKAVEVTVPAAITIGDAYQASEALVDGGECYLAMGSGFLGLDGDVLKSVEAPYTWNVTKDGELYTFTSADGSLYVNETSITVSSTNTSKLKLVKNSDTGNYYLTDGEGKYVTLGADGGITVAAAVPAEGDRPVNPLAIVACVDEVVPPAKPSFPEGKDAVTEVTTADLGTVAGKYAYITFADKFLTVKDKNSGSYLKAASAKYELKAVASPVTLGNISQWQITEVSKGLYSFTNVSGVKLAFDKDGNFNEAGDYKVFSYVNGVLSYTVNGVVKNVTVAGDAVSASGAGTAATLYTLNNTTVGADAEAQVKYLNKQLGNGFVLSFMKGSDDNLTDLDVVSNPFTSGQLTAVTGPTNASLTDKMFLKVSGSYPISGQALSDIPAAKRDEEQLKAFRSSSFIAIDTIRYSGNITDVTSNNFFKYVVVKGSEMVGINGDHIVTGSTADDFKEGHKLYGVDRRVENAEFVAEQAANANYTNPVSFKVETVYMPAEGTAYTQKGVLYHTSLSDAPYYLTYKFFNGANYVGAYTEGYNNIRFSYGNIVKRNELTGIVNIISRNYKTNGMVYATVAEANGDRIGKLDASRVVLHNPEGQFYVSADANNNFTFTNRESGKTVFTATTPSGIVNSPKLLWEVPGKANFYVVKNTIYGTEGNTIVNDTLEINAATVGDKFDGYANYDKAKELENKTFNILVKSNATGVDDLYLTEKHNNDHTIGLSADESDAVAWRLVKFTDAKNPEVRAADTIYHVSGDVYSYMKKNEYKLKKDTVIMFAYALYNEANNEYLTYNADDNLRAYYCDPKNTSNPRAGQVARFVLKEKADGTHNLIRVYGDGSFYKKTDETYAYNIYSTGLANGYSEKAYIGISDNKLNKVSTAYKQVDNDLFVIKETAAPKYRTVATYDTIKIYKNDNEKIALYERGDFLGMQHVADVNDMAPAMFVDTAKVSNTNRPLYLLVVEPELIWHNANCNIEDHPAVAPTMVDTVKGRFLVNMVDSLNAWGNKHNNPYAWDNYPKLAFVKGAHTDNKLIIDRVNPTAADTIALGGNNVASFAFRYVDRTEGSFLMEVGNGYIKWLNGTPVVVNDMAQAEIFNMNEDEQSDPTANEGISTSEVSVVAGNGTVTIKGAAGKTVTISNILGQTIANTVITSDNAEIAAPAGVVVVAIEGEAAVKAIVK